MTGIMPSRLVPRRAVLGGALAVAGCASVGQAGETPRLGEIAARAGLLFGFAVDPKRLAAEPAYAAFVAGQASIVVAENAMKWNALQPEQGRFVFAEADSLVRFTEAHGIRLRGHNLCWHQALPGWLHAVPPARAETVLRAHIAAVAGRYRGRVQSWDVVNEAIQVRDAQPGGWRDGFWYRALGPRFLDVAFEAARAADPGAVLCYNEYGLEPDDAAGRAKRSAVLAMLRGALERGVPVGALGIQSHLRAGAGPDFGPGLPAFLRDVRALGLEVYVTELDVDDSRVGPTNDDRAVAATVGAYLDLVLGTGAVSAVLCWGVWDWPHRMPGTSHRPGATAHRPFLFGPGGAPKAATWAAAASFERVAGSGRG